MTRPLWHGTSNAVECQPLRIMTICGFPDRQRQGLLQWPPVFDSAFERRHRHADSSRPFRCSQRLAAKRQPSITPRVVGLRAPVGPAAIFAAIWAVVIDSVKGVRLRRPRPHVAIERREASSPLVAHANTSSAVAVKSLRGSHVTSAPSSLPDCVLGAVAFAVCRDAFEAKASTTSGVAAPEGWRGHDRGLSAVAHAIPRGVAAYVGCARLNNKATVTMSGECD